jgi:hypothetical protein
MDASGALQSDIDESEDLRHVLSLSNFLSSPCSTTSPQVSVFSFFTGKKVGFARVKRVARQDLVLGGLISLLDARR